MVASVSLVRTDSSNDVIISVGDRFGRDAFGNLTDYRPKSFSTVETAEGNTLTINTTDITKGGLFLGRRLIWHYSIVRASFLLL